MDWGMFFTVVGTGLAIAAFLNQIIRNFKEDVKDLLKKQDENFAKHEKRFEMIDQRLFLLCMGKTLPEILKAEREVK